MVKTGISTISPEFYEAATAKKEKMPISRFYYTMCPIVWVHNFVKGGQGMSFNITDKVSWVGKVDWEPRKFHGEEYTTQRDASYDACLVRDEKTVLIKRFGDLTRKNLLQTWKMEYRDSKIEGRAKATAKEIADKIRPRFEQQGWIK